MGHLRHYFDNGVLLSEAQAWDYALDHFTIRGEEIEDETRRYMWRTCLDSYHVVSIAMRGRPTTLANGDRHHVRFVYDEPGELFWKVKEKILGPMADGA